METEPRKDQMAQVDSHTPDAESVREREYSLAALTWRRFLRHRMAVVSCGLLAVVVLMAVLAGFIAPRGPYAVDYEQVLAAPNAEYILGTDRVGRDVWARLCVGSRVSLAVGLVAVVIAQFLGIVFGSIAGYYGRAADSVIMRLTDVMLCFPWLILMLVVAAAFGPGLSRTMLVIGLVSWPRLARIVRAEFLSLRERDFVLAASCLGVPSGRLILYHFFPNVVPYVIVEATFGMADAILSEAALSFLGMGVAVPTPSWGNMLRDAQSLHVLTNAPWFWLPPGIAVSLTVLAIQFIGDGLRDALDPRALVESRR